MRNTTMQNIRRSVGRSLPRFNKNNRGGVAVETVLVAPVVFGLILASFELGILFTQSIAIESGVEEARRQTLIGKVQTYQSNDEQVAAVRTAFCSQAGWIIFSCDKVYFDMRSFRNFSSISIENPISNGVLDTKKLKFSPGGPCSIVVLRAYYTVTALTSFLYSNAFSLSDGRIVLTGAAAFKNEPFGPCAG